MKKLLIISIGFAIIGLGIDSFAQMGESNKNNLKMTNHDIRWIQRFSNYNKALAQLSKFISKGKLNICGNGMVIDPSSYTSGKGQKTLQKFKQTVDQESSQD